MTVEEKKENKKQQTAWVVNGFCLLICLFIPFGPAAGHAKCGPLEKLAILFVFLTI